MIRTLALIALSVSFKETQTKVNGISLSMGLLAASEYMTETEFKKLVFVRDLSCGMEIQSLSSRRF